MKNIKALIQACKTGTDSNPAMVKAAEDDLAEIERERETTGIRYSNLATEHIDTTKRERAMAHALHKLKLAIGADKAANAEPKLTPEFQTWLDGWSP